MDKKISRGMTPEESPYPMPEMAFGNVVRLKRDLTEPDTGQVGRWGVIVTHIERNTYGIPKVQLVVHDDDDRLLMAANHVPFLCEQPASAFLLWRLSIGVGSDSIVPGGFDLYATCTTCNGSGNLPDDSDVCHTCNGSAHVNVMRRLPESAIPKPPPDIDLTSLL